MSWQEKLRRVLVKNEDVVIETSGPVSQSESLDQMTSIVEFPLADTPELVSGDPLSVELIDLDLGITRFTHFGSLDALDTESHPAATVVRVQGELAKLRFVKTGSDMNLTGMTDGEAIGAILTFCGVSFDSDDIQDAGYVLGALEPIYWRKDNSASAIIDEIDGVFGMKTYEVGHARVVRNAYDLAPDSTNLYRTFTRGSSPDLFALHHSLGQRDQIQNVWSVRGVTVPCGSQNACNCTPWASARSSNPQLARRKDRTQAQSFSSDLIQDESLAEAIVRRLMRWYNRTSESWTVQTMNDANIHPTSVIALNDETAYMAGDETAYATVTTVDRSGFEMTIQATGGAPGDEGTVEHGVEQMCNEDESDGDLPGDFDPPPAGGPPLDDGDPFDPDDLPDTGWDETTPPPTGDPDERYVGCTPAAAMTGSSLSFVVQDDLRLLSTFEDVSDSIWRAGFGAAGMGWLFNTTGTTIEELWFGQTGEIIWNETPGPQTDKNTGNDVIVPAGAQFVISGEVWFGGDDLFLTAFLQTDESVLEASVTFYTSPAFELTTAPSHPDVEHFAVKAGTEHEPAKYSAFVSPGGCPQIGLNCNNGGYAGKDQAFADNTWIPFQMAFDLSGNIQRVDFSGGAIGGYIQDNICWGNSCEHATEYETCDHTDHKLVIVASGITSAGVYDADTPGIKLRTFGLGHSTCEPNPDYDPPPRE